MKRITIDDDLCQGTQECVAVAAHAVEIDDDGIARPNDVVLDDDLADRLAATCPSMAIAALPAD